METTGQTTSPDALRASWPIVPPLDAWRDTFNTLHMWTQIVGKIRLASSAPLNHSWGSALYVTNRGLTTSPLFQGGRAFTIDLDFFGDELRVETAEGNERAFDLEPMSVADFYVRMKAALRGLGLEVHIVPRPVEVMESIPFEQDRQHASYDPRPVHAYWMALVQADRVFKRFRAGFIGKGSPVHFFWGGFDLAVTRFSGRTAPTFPGGVPNCPPRVMEEAYSHEVSSAGLWPGLGLGGQEAAAFYSYAYPTPAGFADQAVAPQAAYFHKGLGEFILPYEAVRTAADPDGTLLSFLQSTYAAAAGLAKWDRAGARAPARLIAW